MEGLAEQRSPGNENQYSGYQPPGGDVTTIDRISPDTSPQVFFENYIAKRKPVIIQGAIQDDQWKGEKWTNTYLRENAGAANVIVERRGDGKSATFGLTAPKVNMTYGEFISNLMEGNDRLYLTTQDLERFEDDLDDFDMPQSVLAEPLKSLHTDFPLQPSLMGNLIPYQLSLWQGIARNATSSGLHHDYHDNLYVLIRGKKRFRLFAPSAGPNMKTAGIISRIYPNGLIVYRNKPDDPCVPVRADGVPMSFLARQRKDDAERELTGLEEALDDLIQSDIPESEKNEQRIKLGQRIEECEQRIEEAMEDILEFGCSGEMDSDDDYLTDSELSPQQNLPQKHLLEGGTENGGPSPHKKQRTCDEAKGDNASSPYVPYVPKGAQTLPKDNHQNSEAAAKAAVQDLEEKMPDHFCDVKFPVSTDDPDEVFAGLPEVKQAGCIFATVSAGEMLYLPASWFHEVTSYTETVEKPESSSEGPAVDSGKDQGHLAFNYWFYPPDNDKFKQPYKGDFWPRRWARIQKGKSCQKSWLRPREEQEPLLIHSDISDSEENE